MGTSNSFTGTVIAPPAYTGSVRLRGVSVSLDSQIGQTFIADCARNTEGLLSDTDIKSKWALSDEDWEMLASNSPLLAAVRAERERRILNGEAAREAAQRHFAKAPNVLNRILTNVIAPRHRIEAARELRQTAASGPKNETLPGEKFTITINLGADEKLVFEKSVAPLDATPLDPPSLDDDGEAS